MTELHLDFETRSPVDLKKAGTYVYAEHPDTDIWCAAYALGDEPVRLWVPGEPCPEDVAEHIRGGRIVTAHNAAFERLIWRNIFAPRYGWPEPKLPQWRCTMVQALALSLPGGLDMLAQAIGVDERKDDAGYRKMMQMSRPRRIEPDGRIVWWDDDARKAILYAYCKQDVVVEREVGRKLLALRPAEQALWQIDQEINDRGVCVDVDLCEASNEIADAMQADLDRQMRDVTAFAVRGCMNAAQLRAWLVEQGIPAETVNKKAVEYLLDRDDLPERARQALTLRQMGSKTSTAKADALLAGMNADGRARGLMQFHAASTGRWGGRRFQPQNLKRPDEDTDVPVAIDLLKTRNLELMSAIYDDPMSIVGDCLRGMVKAAPGNVLRAADFSNIEGRVLAWLAGEQWKLDAFAAFDRKEGPDLYKVAAGAILDKPASEVTKAERQSIGKVSELALGYQGGVGAMQTMSGGRVDFAALYDMLAEKMPGYAERAAEAYEQRGGGFNRRWWEAAEIVKLAWRGTNPAIASLWPDVETAAIHAIESPGLTFTARRLRFRKVGSFLFMQLPSGRCLAYPYPRLTDAETPWGAKVKKIVFMGADPVTKQWGLQDTYGGKLVENATQAVARDMLAHSMVALHRVGWPIVLHVHDEIVCETPEDFGSTEELEAIMSRKPEWLAGCPISAEGWSGERYRK